jgi:shikimate kinase
MNGIGRAWGAISFANALSTGTGASAAIALPVEVRAESPAPGREGDGVTVEPGPATPIVLESARAALRALGEAAGRPIRLDVRSSIPPSQGLKSSSAVSVAVIRAVYDALGGAVSGTAAAGLAADVALSAGGSATGAFDDALAGAVGGLVITRNREREVIRHRALEPSWSVLLWIPGGRHAPPAEWGPRFRARADEAGSTVEALLRGDYLEGLEQNSELVESVMGYAYAPIRRRLREAGALASGVSGLGPTLAVLVERPRVDAVRAALPPSGRVLATRFIPPEAMREGVVDP